MTCKQEYESLLKAGELLEMFPQLKGNWRKDKSIFIELCNENKKTINNIKVNFKEL